MLVKIKSVVNKGLDAIGVDVEVSLANKGLPGFDIVGLADKAVEESKERVKTAILNSGIDFPAKKIIVNLAPADIPKEGSLYDLAIAIGILSNILRFDVPDKSLFLGELSLDGSLRHTKGALLASLFAKKNNFENIFVPKDSANEAAAVRGVNVFPVGNLIQLIAYFLKKKNIEPVIYQKNLKEEPVLIEFDMKEILGQEQAKRAIEIAAAGSHNIIMVGSPGSGKTMLARALPGIMPSLNEEESLEVTKLYSIAGNIAPGGSLITCRQFRSPHHTASPVGLIGGGIRPCPGEISLAHRGVLFLDEFNEFPRAVLEAMRQPLEDGHLTISRSKERVRYPAEFMLVASANPCPCGYLSHPSKNCVCTSRQVRKYQKRISGPILDRIDLHINIQPVDTSEFSDNQKNSELLEPSLEIKKRVAKAKEKQDNRFKNDLIQSNAQMKNSHIKKYCCLTKEIEQLLIQATAKFQLSARSYMKIIKIARTISDLEELEEINISHIAEALQYRPKIYEEI